MIKPSVLLPVFLLCLAVNYEALACSCRGWVSPEEHIEKTGVIFKGRVIKTSFPIFNRVVTTFKVLEKFKGEVSGEVARIHHYTGGGRGDCGVSFSVDQVLIVFTDFDKGILRTSLCSFIRADGDYPDAWNENE